MGNNTETFNKGINQYASQIELRVMRFLNSIAKTVLKAIENNEEMPWYTGNLKDSTGVGVYNKGRLISYAPKRVADEAQYAGDNGDSIWGYKKLEEAFAMGQTLFPTNLWIVVYTAVPYAFELNEASKNHTGFFDDYVKTELVEEIFNNLAAIR